MRIPRAWKLVGLVKPWAVRLRTWNRLMLMPPVVRLAAPMVATPTMRSCDRQGAPWPEANHHVGR